jgi:hypothetical protein
MFRRIVHIWKYLWKSREDKKAELYKYSLNVFKALTALDSATKKEIYLPVKDLYNDLMEINVLQFKVNLIAAPLMFLFSIIVWISVFFLIPFILVTFVWLVNLGNVFYNITTFLDVQILNGGFVGFVVAILSFVVLIWWLFVGSPQIAAFLFVPILSVYPRFFERLRNTRYPVASLVDKLIWLLYNAERYQMQERLGFDVMPISKKKGEEAKEKPNSRMKKLIGYKQQQMLLLERAARCLERYVPRQLHCGDSVTDYWLKETFRLAAAALREKKTWVLTPKTDTYDYFTRSIASTLIHAVNNNWDALERVKAEELMRQQKLARSQLWHFRLVVLVRVAFAAILPVMGFIILQLTPFAITGATRNYVIVGLFIWVGLSILALLDPDLEKKLGMANTIKTLLSLPGKDGP